MMDRNEVIRAHTQWRMGLAAYLKHPDGSRTPAEVERVDTCSLGKWIDSEGEIRYSTDMAFRHLRVAHARFHQGAADIVRRANDGDQVSVETAMGARSGFADASSDVVTSLLALPVPRENERAGRRRVLTMS